VGGAGVDGIAGSDAVDEWIGGNSGNEIRRLSWADAFVFATALNAATNVHTIMDFGAGDKTWLDDAIFSSGFAGITQLKKVEQRCESRDEFIGYPVRHRRRLGAVFLPAPMSSASDGAVEG
jgi:serralysin